MKKVFKTINSQNQRIVAEVRTDNGFISITGEVYQYRYKYPSACGCIHEYLYNAFPKLRKVIPYHLWDIRNNLPGAYPFEKMLFVLFREKNGIDHLKREWHVTDDEAMQIMSLVDYGLTPKKIGSLKTYDDDNLRTFKNFIYKLGIPDRWK